MSAFEIIGIERLLTSGTSIQSSALSACTVLAIDMTLRIFTTRKLFVVAFSREIIDRVPFSDVKMTEIADTAEKIAELIADKERLSKYKSVSAF